jgi:hypothetical protein
MWRDFFTALVACGKAADEVIPQKSAGTQFKFNIKETGIKWVGIRALPW